MAKRTRDAKQSRRNLTRDSVLECALTLLDREGLDALTIRRLAGVLKVSPMALYNHVHGKQDLLQGVAERIVAEARFTKRHRDWRMRIRACFRELRRVCLLHPGVVRLLEGLEAAPAAVFDPMETVVTALREIGFRPREALQAYFLLTNFTMGQVSYEVRGPFPSLDPIEAFRTQRLAGAALSAKDHALLRDNWDFDRSFEFGLSTILDGLDTRMPNRRKTLNRTVRADRTDASV